MNSDWSDLIQEFTQAGVRFLLVGAHAIAAHGIPRATRDIDFWVDPEPTNASRAWQALRRFGAPLDALGVREADLRSPGTVIQIGIQPNRIDLLTTVSGIETFEAAWSRRLNSTLGGVPVAVLGLSDLRVSKRAAGRKRDLLDLEMLDELDRREQGGTRG